MKVLVIVDMQNDFINGSLANPAAASIVNKVADYAKSFDGPIILTRDTHPENYLETYEGKHLPITHCVHGTDGWEVAPEIMDAIKGKFYCFIDKPTFGYAQKIADIMGSMGYVTEIEVVGTVTEICVISNVLGLKPLYPDADFVVHADMCAGLSDEGHKAALTVMKSCQVQVVGE